jgi:hypothetical protein
MELTQSYLKSILYYDPDNGAFVWKVKPCKNIALGANAGNLRPDGYRLIRWRGKREYAHRLAFLYMTGAIPSMIDHIDRDPSNNAWLNLRPTNHSENGINSRQRDSVTGVRGISLERRTGKYYARIHRRGKSHHLGTFDTQHEAISARRTAEASERAAMRAAP